LPILAVAIAEAGLTAHGASLVQSETKHSHETVTGTVRNRVSGEPIAHAKIWISGVKEGSVYTGPDGRFRIDDVPDGKLRLEPAKIGFIDLYSLSGYQSPDNRFDPEYTVGSGNNDFSLLLVPAAKIAGHVTEKGSSPAKNAAVQVVHSEVINGRQYWRNGRTFVTDADGNYQADDLFPGAYLIFAPGYPLEASDGKSPARVAVPAYFGGAGEIASATRIKLSEGQEFRADIYLREAPGYRFSADITGIPGDISVFASVENASGQRLEEGINFDEKTRRLEAQALPAGTWTIVVSGRGGDSRDYEARQEVNVSADVSDLQVPVHRATSIPLIVEHQASPAANSPEEQYRRGFSEAEVSISSADPDNPLIMLGGGGGEPVPPGKYRLHAGYLGKECLDSATFQGVDVLREELTVGSEGGSQPLTLKMTYDCGSLTVHLRSLGENKQAFLVAVPKSFGLIDVRTFKIAGERQARAVTLSPGAYQVFAFSSIDQLEYANPESLRSYSGQAVDLKAGQTAEVTLDVTDPN